MNQRNTLNQAYKHMNQSNASANDGQQIKSILLLYNLIL